MIPQKVLVFNKQLRIKHLDISSTSKDSHVYDYLRSFTAKDVCDRVDDLIFKSKRVVFNLGACSGLIAKNINPDKVDTFIQGDISLGNLKKCIRTNTMMEPGKNFPVHYVHCDEEYIPLKQKSVNMAISCMNLHWVNDLVSCFRQVNSVLEDDSPFIGALLGGDTLYELRSSLQLAEVERSANPMSNHCAPKTTGQDIAGLLQRNGFQLITVDISEIRIRYPSIFELMLDLQGMGENNASIQASQHIHRDVLKSAAAIYQYFYGNNQDNPEREKEEGIPATFQVIHFIGWKNPARKVADETSVGPGVK